MVLQLTPPIRRSRTGEKKRGGIGKRRSRESYIITKKKYIWDLKISGSWGGGGQRIGGFDILLCGDGPKDTSAAA